jgi:hypothetical protein
MFNAERAFEEAAELRTARTDSIPGVSSFPSMDERKKIRSSDRKRVSCFRTFSKKQKTYSRSRFYDGRIFSAINKSGIKQSQNMTNLNAISLIMIPCL